MNIGYKCVFAISSRVKDLVYNLYETQMFLLYEFVKMAVFLMKNSRQGHSFQLARVSDLLDVLQSGVRILLPHILQLEYLRRLDLEKSIIYSINKI